MIKSGRLILSKKRMLKHYESGLSIFGISIFSGLYFIYKNINEGNPILNKGWLFFLGLLIVGILLTLNQHRKLKLKKITNHFTREENINFVKLAINNLSWNINFENEIDRIISESFKGSIN